MYRQLPHLLKYVKQHAPLKQSHPLHINNFYIPVIASHCEIRDISAHRSQSLSDENDTWFLRKVKETRIRLGLLPHFNAHYRLRGLRLYREVENVDWRKYFSTFQMPDTFYSWFLITELHMWMLHVRINREKKEGHLLKHFSMEYLWEGSHKRAKSLGAFSSSSIRDAFDNLYQELIAAFIMYDYGFLASDVDLANVLWFRFFQEKCDDPEKVELLVRHVRKQIQLLDKLSTEDLLQNTKITWLPLSDQI